MHNPYKLLLNPFRNNMKTFTVLRLIGASVAIIVVILVWTQLAPPTTTEQQTTATNPAPPSVGRVSLTLYLNDYGYNASKGGPLITAYVGDTIILRLIGNGSGPIVHDFTLDEGSPSPYNVKSEHKANWTPLDKLHIKTVSYPWLPS